MTLIVKIQTDNLVEGYVIGDVIKIRKNKKPSEFPSHTSLRSFSRHTGTGHWRNFLFSNCFIFRHP